MKPLLIVHRPEDSLDTMTEFTAKVRKAVPDDYEVAVLPFGSEVVVIEPSEVAAIDAAVAAEREACMKLFTDKVTRNLLLGEIAETMRNRGKYG